MNKINDSKADTPVLPFETIERSILTIRNHRVMLDADLASLYGVETKTLVRAVKRNLGRFPSDFMLQLTHTEFASLKSFHGSAKQWGGRRYPPFAFTEQGVAMLSGILQSQRAVAVNDRLDRLAHCGLGASAHGQELVLQRG